MEKLVGATVESLGKDVETTPWGLGLKGWRKGRNRKRVTKPKLLFGVWGVW